MKAVMLSIQPKWCEKIASGEKTVEVRKTRPKIETPFKCFIYETNWSDNTYWKNRHKGKLGKVIGEFVCDRIDEYHCRAYDGGFAYPIPTVEGEKTGLTYGEAAEYGGGQPLYFWHISDLVIYDKPKDIDWFRKPMECHRGKQRENCVGCWDCEIKRPPQSWCYVEVQE